MLEIPFWWKCGCNFTFTYIRSDRKVYTCNSSNVQKNDVREILFLFRNKNNRRSSSSNIITLFEWWNISDLFSNELTAEISCWIYSSERQLARMRLAYLRSVLNQEVGAFDTDLTTATIVTGVTNHMSVIQDAIGEKVMDFTIIWSSNTRLLNFCSQICI